MTFDARRKRDRAITRQIARITLDGRELPLRDVYYVDTRRGIVRGYQRDSKGRAFGMFGSRGFEIAKFERRGVVRFWLKGASTWGMQGARA